MVCFSAVQHKSRCATCQWLFAHWGIWLGVVLSLLFQAGCAKAVVKPGVTYEVSIITKEKDGKVTPQGQVTRVESAVAPDAQELSHDGKTLSIVVRKTQYGKATFEITFPDKAVQKALVNVGKSKDILASGQKIGARIEVVESH
jgi:hypothetical protein